MTGQLIKVVAEKVRAVLSANCLQHQAEVQQMSGESNFFSRKEIKRGTLAGLRRCRTPGSWGCAGKLSENAADPGVGILQVWSGVAVQSQQLVPTENVVALAIRQEVRIFDRADADHSRNFAALRLS